MITWQKSKDIKDQCSFNNISRIENRRNGGEINNQRNDRRPFAKVEEIGLPVCWKGPWGLSEINENRPINYTTLINL